jgi:hypothetical protein
MPGYNVRGRIVRGLNVRDIKYGDFIVPVPKEARTICTDLQFNSATLYFLIERDTITREAKY